MTRTFIGLQEELTNSKLGSANLQEELDATRKELDEVKSQLEKAERVCEALHIVNEDNVARNIKLRVSSDKAKSSLKIKQKGLFVLFHTAKNTYMLIVTRFQITTRRQLFGRKRRLSLRRKQEPFGRLFGRTRMSGKTRRPKCLQSFASFAKRINLTSRRYQTKMSEKL